MNHEAIIRHLTYYSDMMIKDFGLVGGRRYLRGCIPIWCEAYGADISAHMAQLIKQKLDKIEAAN